jgi:hypothetical protein
MDVAPAIETARGYGAAAAGQAEPWPASRIPHWGDDGWWQAQIDAA